MIIWDFLNSPIGFTILFIAAFLLLFFAKTPRSSGR